MVDLTVLSVSFHAIEKYLAKDKVMSRCAGTVFKGENFLNTTYQPQSRFD